MPDNDKLARDIFGGSDSELSEDDDLDVRRDPSPDEPSDDEYKKPTKERPPPRKRKRTAKRKQRETVDINDLPPEQASKHRIDLAIEAALKSGKKTSRPKKRKNDDQVLDSFADDQVARLRETMITAADEDIRSNQEKLPATAKLRALPDAMDTLRKASLAQSIIDNNLLEAVRRWLEPLPDRSLPTLNIQRELFTTLRKMEFIDSSVIKEAGLGPLVLFYTKCKRVTPDVARIANELVSTWSRPIIKRSASFRDRHIPIASTLPQDGDDLPTATHRPEKLNAILARAREEDKNRVRKNAVMIPQASLGTYTVAPSMNAGVMRNQGRTSVDQDVERRRKNAERLRSLTRKVKGD
ncbi:Transcription factor iws1 [Stygiomarasmius scandens]|uniref:Transcription factor iws1 n=1 Tax=Marasmiellus scandens TaxID=2682957 RepID=A0ABR1JS93_9AGAR